MAEVPPIQAVAAHLVAVAEVFNSEIRQAEMMRLSSLFLLFHINCQKIMTINIINAILMKIKKGITQWKTR